MKFFIPILTILAVMSGCSGIHLVKKRIIKVSDFEVAGNNLSADTKNSRELNDAIEFVDSFLCKAYGFQRHNEDIQSLKMDQPEPTNFRIYGKANTRMEAAVFFSDKKNKLKITLYDRQFFLNEIKYFKELHSVLRRELEIRFGTDRVK